MNDRAQERKWIIFIFLFALALRVGYWFYLQKNYFFFANPGEDVLYYKNWAKAIVDGGAGQEGSFAGMPLFAYYLAVLFRLSFGHWEIVNFFNLVLGAGNCVLVYLLTKKLFPEPTTLVNRVAIVAGLLAAANFVLIYYDWLMMPITLLIALTLVILISVSGEGPATKRNWFLIGLFLGLASLGDGKFLIFTALLISYFIWRRFNFLMPKIIHAIVPLSLGLAVILGGVTVRNKIVGGEWVFITSQSGLSLFVGNNPQATGAYEHPEFLRPSHEGQDLDQKLYAEAALGRKANSVEVSDFYRQKAVTFITTQPLEYLKLLGKKLELFAGDHEQTQAIDLILQREYKNKLDWNSFSLILPLAILGIAVCLQKKKNTTLAVLLVASQLIFSLIYFVTTRHRASILPVLLIFEAYALNWLAEKIYLRQYRIAGASFLSVLIFMFYTPARLIDTRTFAFLNYSKAGSTYDAKKDYQNAAIAYHAALQLQPNDANNLYNLATAYVNLKLYAQAENLFRQALAITPFNVDVLFNLGYVYEKKGETQNALKTYTKVLNFAPDSLDAHFRIAGLYQNLGLCDQTKPHIDAIVRHNPLLEAELKKIFDKCDEK